MNIGNYNSMRHLKPFHVHSYMATCLHVRTNNKKIDLSCFINKKIHSFRLLYIKTLLEYIVRAGTDLLQSVGGNLIDREPVTESCAEP